MDGEQEANLMSNTTNWTSTNISNFDQDDYDFRNRLFVELFSLICLLSLLSNILIIFTILKYKKLWLDASNKLILHITILQAIFLLFTPIIVRIVIDFDWVQNITPSVLCVYNEIENVTMVAMLLLLIMLLFEWYIKKYYENTYPKFLNIYRFLIVAIYILTFMVIVLASQFCFKHVFLYLTLQIICLLLIIIALAIIIINIIHRVKSWRRQSDGKPNTGLAIANIFILLWCPAIFLTIFTINNHFYEPILFIVLSTLGFTSPIFNVIYLFWYDNNFNCFIRKVFKCQCNDYSNEILTDDQSVSYTINGVHIANH